MPRISTGLGFDLNLRALQDGQSKLYSEQTKISSGLSINSPKDNPIVISRILSLKHQQALSDQYLSSISSATNDLNLEEVQLNDIITQLHSAKELVIQANASGVRSSQDQQAIAIQLEQIRDQLINLANTNVDGRYIFSGSKTLDKPVSQNAAGAYVYNGNEAIRNAQIGASLIIPTLDTAKNMFFDIATTDLDIAGFSGRTNVTSNNGGLVTSGSLGVVTANTLKINGIYIDAASTDGVSTTDPTASAIATAAAINLRTNLHGVIAEANANVFNFTGGTYTVDPLVAGDLTINGVQVIGVPNTADAAGLAGLINSLNGGAGISGVVAVANAGQLQLQAQDGRNIQIQTSGNAATMNFTNFATTGGGGALNSVQKATISLVDHKAVTIEGSSTGLGATKIGITSGTYQPTANGGTAVLSAPFIYSVRPENSLNNEKYLIKFVSATTFNIYKESDPTVAVSNVQKFSSAQTKNQATVIQHYPIDYTAGDTILVDGLEFNITGTPNVNDTFTVELTPVNNNSIFGAIQNAIDGIRQYGGDSQRLSYHMGLAITNIENSEARITEILSSVGSRLNMTQTQQSSTEDFNFFATQSISNLQDLDYTEAISTLLRYQMSFDATQRVAARIQELSLFRYL